MSMKKLLLVFLMILLTAGCTKSAKEIVASDFLSLEEAGKYLEYLPVEEVNNTRLCKSVTYKNEKIGQGDTVKVDVYPFNGKYDKSEIKAQFEAEKKRNDDLARTVAVDIEGVDAFIAIPSCHMYKNGYYIVITAGSGAGEHQVSLLKNYAETVSKNLIKIAGEEETETEKTEE